MTTKSQREAIEACNAEIDRIQKQIDEFRFFGKREKIVTAVTIAVIAMGLFFVLK